MVELTAESVESAALTLQSVDDVHGGDGLSLGVLRVGNGITDDILEEDLENAAGLFIDEARDTFDTASTRETTDGGLGDTLDVITQHFAMTFGASLSEALSSFAASRHNFLRITKWSVEAREFFPGEEKASFYLTTI